MRAIYACVVAFTLLLCGNALAQTRYPETVIRILVGFPAGTAPDVVARIIADKMNLSFGKPVVIENISGASGNIACDRVAKALPDGYTLVMCGNGSLVVAPSLYEKLPYDPAKDFAPISRVFVAANLLVVHPDVPAKSLAELVALAKAKPGELTYGHTGVGTSQHLAGELFKSMARVDITHVPYKGNVPAITDLLSGQTHMVFATMPTVLPHVKAGKLKGVAVLGATRSPAVPDVPAMAETLPGFEVNNWIGTFGPAGLPADIASRLNAEILALMRTPAIQQRLLAEGARFTPMAPARFAEFVAAETAKWGKLIREVGIHAD